MTASDPRVGEIEAEVVEAAAKAIGGRYWETAIDDARAALEAAAPHTHAYLLAELADRDEKLAKVEDVLAKKYLLWAAICGNTCSKDILGVDHDAIADEIAAAIRAAVAAANGGGE